MKREFTINIILLLLINFLIKPAYIFGVDARVQNLVGTEDYGTYFAYFNFVFLFQFLNDPGLQTWNAQFVPKNRGNINVHITNLLTTKLVLSFSFIIFALIAGFLAGYHNVLLLATIAINLILSTLFMLIRTTISGLGYYRVDSWFSALDKTLMRLIIGYLAWVSSYKNDFDIMLLVYGQMLAYILSVIISGTYLLGKTQIQFNHVSKFYILTILRSSAPYVLAILFMTTYNRLDGVMLSKMLNDNNYEAGVYASAYRFYDAANMVGYLFAALLLPMFSANLYNKPILEDLKN
ncbi:MAG: oligosaccharide flippase family protein [Saprospiraceae bacterium]|nr:oligosaccharide flippase family protein [Saprospiraceae bacterium]